MEPSTVSSRKGARWSAGLLLFLLCSAPLALSVRPSFALSHDAATYAILGESLAAGRGYTYQGYAHIKYPPGYPALLAGHFRVAGRDVAALRIFTAACGVLALLAAWRLAGRRSGEAVGAGVLAATAGTAFFVEHAAFALSDVPFAACLAAACLAARRLLARPGPGSGLLTGLLILVGASLRVVGVLLVPALFLAWLTRRREPGGRRSGLASLMLASAVVALGVGLWMRHRVTAGPLLPESTREGATYQGELQGGLWLDVPQGFLPNLLFQLKVRPVILAGTAAGLLTGDRIGRAGQAGWAAPGAPVSILLLALLLSAALRSLWRHRSVLDWFFWLYLGVLLATPPFYGYRYFLPVLPFLWGALLEGAVDLAGRRASPGRRGLLLGLACAGILAVWAGPLVRTIARERAEPSAEGHAGAFRAGLEFLRREAPEGAVTICNEAALVFYLTGRPAFGFPLTSPEEVAAFIEDRGDLVLLSTWGYPVHEGLLRQAALALAARGRLELWHQEQRGEGALTMLLRKKAGSGS